MGKRGKRERRERERRERERSEREGKEREGKEREREREYGSTTKLISILIYFKVSLKVSCRWFSVQLNFRCTSRWRLETKPMPNKNHNKKNNL